MPEQPEFTITPESETFDNPPRQITFTVTRTLEDDKPVYARLTPQRLTTGEDGTQEWVAIDAPDWLTSDPAPSDYGELVLRFTNNQSVVEALLSPFDSQPPGRYRLLLSVRPHGQYAEYSGQCEFEHRPAPTPPTRIPWPIVAAVAGVLVVAVAAYIAIRYWPDDDELPSVHRLATEPSQPLIGDEFDIVVEASDDRGIARITLEWYVQGSPERHRLVCDRQTTCRYQGLRFDTPGTLVFSALVEDVDDNEVEHERQVRIGHLLRVAVFDNADPDYASPPFDDRLLVYDVVGSTRTTLLDRTGFNTSQTVGGSRSLTMSPAADLVFTVENVANRLTGRGLDGRVAFTAPGQYRSVVVTADHVLALRGGTIHGDALDRFQHDGALAGTTTELRGLDLAIDEANDAIWTVGGDLRKGKLSTLGDMTKLDLFAWSAVSVDVASDGSIFVAERKHPSSGGANRILHISPDFDILKTTDLGGSPFCVRVDRVAGAVWVAHQGGLTVLSRAGVVLKHITGIGTMWSVSPHPDGGKAWAVGGYGNDTGGLWSANGSQLDTLPDLSSDQKYIWAAAVP